LLDVDGVLGLGQDAVIGARELERADDRADDPELLGKLWLILVERIRAGRADGSAQQLSDVHPDHHATSWLFKSIDSGRELASEVAQEHKKGGANRRDSKYTAGQSEPTMVLAKLD
jgi:hypothetical protein